MRGGGRRGVPGGDSAVPLPTCPPRAAAPGRGRGVDSPARASSGRREGAAFSCRGFFIVFLTSAPRPAEEGGEARGCRGWRRAPRWLRSKVQSHPRPGHPAPASCSGIPGGRRLSSEWLDSGAVPTGAPLPWASSSRVWMRFRFRTHRVRSGLRPVSQNPITSAFHLRT